MGYLSLLFSCVFILFNWQCVPAHHPLQENSSGLLEDSYLAYVPAQIAIMNCRTWPKTAPLEEMSSDAIDKDVLQELCQAFDEFVLNGFTDQPYMKGFAPKSVAKFIAKANLPEDFPQIEESFRIDIQCAECSSPAAYYKTQVAERIPWKEKLTTLAKATRFSDALLIPFVLQGHADQELERGLRSPYQVVEVALLLIDLGNGQLIWHSSRSIRLSLPQTVEAMKDFDWKSMYRNLFTEVLFAQFPGRIVY